MILWRAHVNSDACHRSLSSSQLLVLCLPPFPDVSTTGVSWAQCPDYSLDRRPDLVHAAAYFQEKESSSDGGSSSSGLKTATVAMLLALAFVVGGVVAGVALVGAAHCRDSQAQEKDLFEESLLLPGNGQQKAKRSY